MDALHGKALPHVFREPDPSEKTSNAIVIVGDENAVQLVAQTEDQIAGAVQVWIQEQFNLPAQLPRRYAVIHKLIVKEEFRCSGIDPALMEEAHQWVLGKGATQIELIVWEFNEGAIAFYEKLGYETAYRKMWKSLK